MSREEFERKSKGLIFICTVILAPTMYYIQHYTNPIVNILAMFIGTPLFLFMFTLILTSWTLQIDIKGEDNG